MTRIIHIAGNSGSGKSVLALNLGFALSKRGMDVILLDGNIYSPDIANYSDIFPAVFLNEFLSGERMIEEIITFHPSGMKMIPSMPEENYSKEHYEKLNKGLLSLIGKAEIILIDSFSQNPANFSILDNADETIFVTNDDFPSIIKAKDFIKKLEEKGMNVIGVIVNRKRKKSCTRKNVEAVLEKPVISEIPFDERLIDSINRKQPVYLTYPESKSSKALKELADILDIVNR